MQIKQTFSRPSKFISCGGDKDQTLAVTLSPFGSSWEDRTADLLCSAKFLFHWHCKHGLNLSFCSPRINKNWDLSSGWVAFLYVYWLTDCTYTYTSSRGRGQSKGQNSCKTVAAGGNVFNHETTTRIVNHLCGWIDFPYSAVEIVRGKGPEPTVRTTPATLFCYQLSLCWLGRDLLFLILIIICLSTQFLPFIFLHPIWIFLLNPFSLPHARNKLSIMTPFPIWLNFGINTPVCVNMS